MTSRHPPVEDWATDFDHTDPAWVADPYPIWEDLRQRCPVAHSDRYGGTWLPVTHELVSEVAYDTEHFTSRSVVVGEERPGPDDLPAPIGLSPPITSDPPFHAMARGMLLPAFGPSSAWAEHRCLGSSLARMELRVALEEWLDRYPDFELADPAVTWSGGQVRGPRTLPLTIL